MAFSTIKSVLVVFLVLLLCLLMLLQPSSGCMTGQQGCLYDDINLPKNLNRKMLLKSNSEKNKVVVNGPKTETGGKGMVVGWELREAPLGPDPLHHHGASPKKPGTKSP